MPHPNLGRGGLPVYAPVGATLSIASGSANVSFTGTAFQATNPQTGATEYSAGVGDTLVISGEATAIIESIVDATHVVLAEPWRGSSHTSLLVNGSPNWYVVRNSVPAFGSNAKAIQDLLAKGSDDAPDLSRTIDNGAARIKIRVNSVGIPEIAVGPSGADDVSLIPSFQIDPTTGAVTFIGGSTVGGGGGGGGGSGINFRYITGNGSVAAGDLCYADTSAGIITLALPTSPTTGQGVQFRDAAGTWSTNNLILNPGSNKVATTTGSFVCNVSNADFDLVWRGGSVGWAVEPIGVSGGTGSRYRHVTANDSPAIGDIIWADTSSVSILSTVPTSPNVGDGIAYRDALGTWATHNLTIDPGSNPINGASGTLVCNVSDANFDLVWRGGSIGWYTEFIVSKLARTA